MSSPQKLCIIHKVGIAAKTDPAAQYKRVLRQLRRYVLQAYKQSIHALESWFRENHRT